MRSRFKVFAEMLANAPAIFLKAVDVRSCLLKHATALKSLQERAIVLCFDTELTDSIAILVRNVDS
jgi:hypothetical protein